jgi:hypothetical protein
MSNQAASVPPKGESKKMTDLKINLNVIKGFLTLVELLNTLPNIKKAPYDSTRSLYQAVSKGRDIETLGKVLEDFFGPPRIPAGKAMPKRMLFHPSIKYLDGVRKEQALYIKNTKNGFYYGALWPWLKVPSNITIHLGYCGNKMTGKDFEKLEKQVKTGLLNKQVFDELSADEGGRIYGISLGSFLQMAEMEKISCTLQIKTSGAVGLLYLMDGTLVAAETGNLKNRAAAYEILSWSNTDIDIKEICDKKKNKIKQPLVEVLSEALRVRKKKNGSGKVSAAAAGVAPSNVAGDRYQALRMAQLPEKNRKLPIILGSVLGVLVICAAVMFGMRLMKNMQVERDYRNLMAQVADTKKIEDKKTLLHYYIKSHEDSEFTQLAQKKIRQIETQQEEKEFKKMLKKISQLPIDAEFRVVASELYNQFLEKYPDTKYYNEIQEKMLDIPGLIDDVDFEMLEAAANADYANRIEAYLGYLMKHPNGRHKKKVEILIKNMSADYFALLMREIPRCDQKENWDACIVLCDNYLDFFQNDSNTAEVRELKTVMEDKKDVADLMAKVKSLGDRFVMSKKILTNYLEENPDSIQVEKIKETLTIIQRNLAMNREWEALLQYSQDSRIDFDERITQLNHYISQNPESPYTQKAKTILAQLQQQKRVRYVQRIEAERNRQFAAQEKERNRLIAETNRVVSQIQNSAGRFKVNGTGTFVDTKTGATWSLLDSASVLNKCLDYRTAERYVKSLNTGGYTDWRLPYGNELIELYKTKPFFTGKSAPWYWTTEVFVKGYHKKALVVTSEKQLGYKRDKIDLYQCGAVRAVRP